MLENFVIYQDLYGKPFKRDGGHKLFFSFKSFWFSAFVAIATFEICGWKFTGFQILMRSFSSCKQKFWKANCFRVYRKLITWSTNAKGQVHILRNDEAFSLPCVLWRKFKIKLWNLLTESREKKWVLLSFSSARAVRAIACANHSLQSCCCWFFLKRILPWISSFPTPESWILQSFLMLSLAT